MAHISEVKCLLLRFVFLLTSLLETGVKGSTHNFCTKWNKTQFMLQHFTLKTDKSYSTWIHMNTLNECCESLNHGNEWYNVNGCDKTECIILMSLTSVKRRPPSRSDTKKICSLHLFIFLLSDTCAETYKTKTDTFPWFRLHLHYFLWNIYEYKHLQFFARPSVKT